MCRLAFLASTWTTAKKTVSIFGLAPDRLKITYANFRTPQQNEKEDECIKTADDRQAHDNPERYEHDHPAPGNEAIQSQCYENELDDVHGAEELKFEISIVLHCPEADGDREETYEDQRNKAEHPNMSSGFQLRKRIWS